MSPETLRGRALECMRLAQTVRDPRHRTLLLEMAHSWAELANSAERLQAMVAESASLFAGGEIKPRRRRTRAREHTVLH